MPIKYGATKPVYIVDTNIAANTLTNVISITKTNCFPTNTQHCTTINDNWEQWSNLQLRQPFNATS